ncbi:MAG: DUF1127 domain-containing protein [Proteobacteria bacterium]|nr:DUF1127 domain-containing protein [Pseudomonadota bacterium]
MTTLRLHHILDDLDISAAFYTLVQKIESTAKAVDKTIATWIGRTEDRRQLARMSDHMLNDIGLNRIEIANEINKPFWQR